MQTVKEHIPVLLNESIDALKVEPGKRYIDATFGAGGHTKEILKRGGEVLSIEFDPKMIKRFGESLEGARVVEGNFVNIDKIAKENGFHDVDGVLFDLGISSVHLDSDERGFSFKNEDAPLDMRLSPEFQGVTAADLLNSLPKSALAQMFEFGMNRHKALDLSSKIIKEREEKKFETVGDLLDIVGRERRGKIHSGTKAFMALRIAVNSELANLSEALPKAYGLLKSGGVLAVITFHSGEDRVVKEFKKDLQELILPSDEEISENPRSRSAKLRIIKKS